VIGDPVNEAARLSDLAKVSAGRVLASGTVHEQAHPGEAAAWEVGRPVTLRGRRRPTRLVTPRPTTPLSVSLPVYGVPEAAVSAARRLRLPRTPRLRRPRLVLLRPSIPIPRIIRSARETPSAEDVTDVVDGTVEPDPVPPRRPHTQN
jgi:adenylate cyclase